MTTWAQGRQLALLDDPLDVRFAEFHQANPHVYGRLVEMARDWKAAGYEHGSIAMFYEALRYETGVATHGDQFRLNNSFRSRYARLVEATVPDLIGFFHTRTLGTDAA